LIIQTILLDPPGAVWTDSAGNVSGLISLERSRSTPSIRLVIGSSSVRSDLGSRRPGNSFLEVCYSACSTVAGCQWRLAKRSFAVAGDRERATVAARAAHETAMRLGAEPLRDTLEALARRGRLDLGAGVPVERTLAGLTPRELEVLQLLVEGRSNRQIAETLFISGKTASVHVTNILTKLGCTAAWRLPRTPAVWVWTPRPRRPLRPDRWAAWPGWGRGATINSAPCHVAG
jgi:Bacterial regulatory proteins, luxR family